MGEIDQAERIPLFKPLLEQEEHEAAQAALQLGWLGMGSYVAGFEQAIANLIEVAVPRVVAVSTGHAALHLALLIADIQAGDEVMTPSFNNAADFQAILATGGVPVFCDIREDTLCIDVEDAERRLTSRTKAIIATDYGHQICDHDALRQMAKRRNLRVIHDAAHSFGSRYSGQMVGNFSDFTIFSFDPIKNITCIDGGAIVLPDVESADAARSMRFLGMTQSTDLLYRNRRARTYDIETIGFRYHMANLHAAIGMAQIAKMKVILESRQNACHHYNKRLSRVAAVDIPAQDLEHRVPFMYYIRVPANQRDGLRAYLDDRGIETGIHWRPGHQFTLLKQFHRGDLKTTERVANEIVSLPLHSKISLNQVDRVSDAIAAFFDAS
jgi:dTDP-4-amino-4,6-dideoxygalactose transaminase